MKIREMPLGEIMGLVRVRYEISRAQSAGLQAHLRQTLGQDRRAPRPEEVALEGVLYEGIVSMTAARLKQDDRSRPLFSADDLLQAVPAYVDTMQEAEGETYDPEKRAFLERVLKEVMAGLMDGYEATLTPGVCPYQEYQLWADVVHGLAAERGVAPAELIGSEEAADEIVRRTCTKEQYVARFERASVKYMDPETVKKIMLKSFLDSLFETVGADETARRELSEMVEARLVPVLSEQFAIIRPVLDEYIKENVARIYPA